MRTVFMSSPFLRWGRTSSSRTQRLGSPRTVSGDTRTARRGGADLNLGGRDRYQGSLARVRPRGCGVCNRAISALLLPFIAVSRFDIVALNVGVRTRSPPPIAPSYI